MSSFKAFLCSIDGTYNFPLLPKVTTIGRENCDIIINSPNIDSQHAVIEYCENENTFVIQDLNTVNGTYINDCRVQNAAIRLAEQDVIRFGFNGMPFQFLLQGHNIQTTTMPPINMSRSNGNQTLQLINQTIPSRYSGLSSNQNTNSSIWINIPATNAQLLTSNNYQNSSQSNCENNMSLTALKAPASLRTRPTSASGIGIRKFTKEVNATTTSNTNLTNNHHPQLNGWIKGNSNNANVHLNELKLNMSLDLEPINTGTNDSELHNRLFQLEKELKMKTNEVKELNERIIQIQNQFSQQTTTTTTVSKDSPKNELEQVKRDKSIATGLINTMQKDLSTKDATISKLAREIENLKKEIGDKDVRIIELNEKLGAYKDTKKSDEEKQNKEKELLVLKNKIKSAESKIVDLNNTVLQIKGELEESQRLLLKNSQNEKNLKDELEHVKNQFLDMQRAERIVRIDLEQAKRQYEKFRNLIIQTLFSTPGIAQPTGEVADDDLISIWKKIIDERTKLNEKIENLKEKLKENESKHSESSSDIKHIENKFILIQTHLNKRSGRSSNELIETLDEFEKLKVHDSLNKIRTVACEIIRHNVNIQSEIESSLKLLNIDVDNNFGLSVLMKSIKDKLQLHEVQKATLQKQLEETEIRHSQQMDTLSREKLIEYEQLLEKRISEINEKHANEISTINKAHEEKLNSLLNSSQLSQNEVALELNTSKSQLIELNNEIQKLKESLDTAISTISSLNLQINMKEEDYKAQLMGVENSNHEAVIRYSQDLEIYKEQIRQHALTIVGFEKEISSVRQRETDLLSQIEILKKRIIELEKASIKKVTPPPSPPPKIDSEILLLQKTIENLRMECSIYSKRIAEQEEIIKVLRRDLITATAKYSDVQSEISEKQKRELEKSRALIHEQTRELSETRSQLSKLSEIVETQTKQITTLKSDLAKANSLVEKFKISAEENGNLVIELKAKLDSGQLQLKKYETIRHEEGKITSELTAIGAQCRGERHEQVISRQREALNELRQRVKTLEQSRPLVPAAQQQMQQQVMLLKKQLAEFRANQALTEDIAKQASMTRGNDQNLLMIEEKTAHYDTQSALDYSEETYLNLLRSIASMVDLEHIDGLRSMANLPIDERERLLTARNRAIDTICTKLKDMKESVDRKDKLLGDYELDLAKLRQAEFLLQKKSEQLEQALLESRNKEDEIELLRESLKNSRFQIDQEKILNSNIKQKKFTGTSMGFDRIRKGSTDTLHHHCPPDTDSRVKDAKKTMSEKLKKKDYELKVLKQELRSKHEELSEISNRIKIHENGQDLYS